jgi:hypothetical protein
MTFARWLSGATDPFISGGELQTTPYFAQSGTLQKWRAQKGQKKVV